MNDYHFVKVERIESNGDSKPKKLKREKVKEVLLSFRRTLQETARSECREGSVTTFDYI